DYWQAGKSVSGINTVKSCDLIIKDFMKDNSKS
ncbi:MAG: hypothetical protein ACI9AP_000335, partial [Flavobacteriales bacterium]